MRLPGRLAAAIEVLGDIEARRRPAADALRDWGLSHRFAGAGDRAAIGNLVYDALRRRASIAWTMRSESPRALALGAVVLLWGETPESLAAMLADDPHAPDPLSDDERARLASFDLSGAPDHVRADVPEWVAAPLAEVFGDDWVAEGQGLAGRPPLDLRVNTLKADVERATRQLSRLGVVSTPFSPAALRVPPSSGARRHPNVQAEEAFLRGRVEVQDEGSQLCALLASARPGEQLLDYCAGAGGKTLALAAAMENRGQIYAYDRDRNRLAPIFERLQRAGARNVQVRFPEPDALKDLEGRMDCVLVDAPCTGSGVWRRRPDAKWRLTPQALEARQAEQDAVLSEAAGFVRPGGRLVFATCSLFRAENAARLARFRADHPDFVPVDLAAEWPGHVRPGAPAPRWIRDGTLVLTPASTGTDGFFVAALECRGEAMRR